MANVSSLVPGPEQEQGPGKGQDQDVVDVQGGLCWGGDTRTEGPGQSATWQAGASFALQQLAQGAAHEREAGLQLLAQACSELKGGASGAGVAAHRSWLADQLLSLICCSMSCGEPSGGCPGERSSRSSSSRQELPNAQDLGGQVGARGAPGAQEGGSPGPGLAPPGGCNAASMPPSCPAFEPGAAWEARQAAFLGARVALDHWDGEGGEPSEAQMRAPLEPSPSDSLQGQRGEEGEVGGAGILELDGGAAAAAPPSLPLSRFAPPAAAVCCSRDAFSRAMAGLALKHLDDPEPRVRLAVAECLAGVAFRAAPKVVQSTSRALLDHIASMLADPKCASLYLPSDQGARSKASAVLVEPQAVNQSPVLDPLKGAGEATGLGLLEEDAPSSPRADSEGLQAAMAWDTAEATGTAGPLASATVMADSPTTGGTLSQDMEGEPKTTVSGFVERQGLSRALEGAGRSLETSVRAVQQLLEGLLRRQDNVVGATGSAAVNASASSSCIGGDIRNQGRGELEHGEVVSLGHSSSGTEPMWPRGIARDSWSTLVRASGHPNRFVREAAFFALAPDFLLLLPMDGEEVSAKSAAALALGLGDNWSQVRYAASVALRRFLDFVGDNKKAFYPVLLPPMAFNRYYGADGVRIYSQATWQEAMGLSGRQEVARHINVVLAFYVAQSVGPSFLAREAACFCIREAADKIDAAAVAPHVEGLLQAVARRHADVFWPVRVAACAASKSLVSQFPAQAEVQWGNITAAWKGSLLDSVPTVRQDSALVFGAALQNMKAIALPVCLQLVREMLPMAILQQECPGPAHACACAHSSELPPGHRLAHAGHQGFGGAGGDRGLQVMRLDLARPGEGAEAREGQVPSPLGSKFTVSYSTVNARPAGTQSVPLATTSGPEAGSQGEKQVSQGESMEEGYSEAKAEAEESKHSSCSSHMMSNCSSSDENVKSTSLPSAPSTSPPAWVQSEAAVLLLNVLSSSSPEQAVEFLPQLGKVAQVCTTLPEGSTGSLLPTLWTYLPALARAVGKRSFKAHLDAFLEPLFTALAGQGSSTLTPSLDDSMPVGVAAASQCLSQLQLFVGPSIFEGRLTASQRQLLSLHRNRTQRHSPAGGSPAHSAAPTTINGPAEDSLLWPRRGNPAGHSSSARISLPGSVQACAQEPHAQQEQQTALPYPRTEGQN